MIPARRRSEDQTQDPPSPGAAAVWIVPVLAWAFVLSFTRKYSSNVPYWDSWEFTELIAGVQPLTLGALWKQHNEHRMVFQTLFEVAMGRYAHWNIYAASFLPGILFAANSLLLIAGALRARQSLDSVARALLVTALTLILFTFRAHVAFTYEMVMSWAILALAMTAFARYFPPYVETGRGLARLVTILVVAMLSTSQGLALAVFVLIVGACHPLVRGRVESRLPRSYPWLAAISAALVVVYFVGYVKPAWHPSVTSVLRHPLDGITYIAVLAGSPFAWDEAWATWIGVGVLSLFAAGLTAMVSREGWQALWRFIVGRPLIGTNLIAMSAIMVGRVGFGPGQATASHYVPFNAVFVVSALLPAFDQLKGRIAQRVVLSVLVVAIIPAWYLGYRNAVDEMTARRDPLEAYRECVLNDPPLLARCDGSHVYPSPATLVRRATLLKDQNLAFFAKRD